MSGRITRPEDDKIPLLLDRGYILNRHQVALIENAGFCFPSERGAGDATQVAKDTERPRRSSRKGPDSQPGL